MRQDFLALSKWHPTPFQMPGGVGGPLWGTLECPCRKTVEATISRAYRNTVPPHTFPHRIAHIWLPVQEYHPFICSLLCHSLSGV